MSPNFIETLQNNTEIVHDGHTLSEGSLNRKTRVISQIRHIIVPGHISSSIYLRILARAVALLLVMHELEPFCAQWRR